MTPAKRKAARARCEAATPGPWAAHPQPRSLTSIRSRDDSIAVVTSDRDDADSAFIAHARADLPAALDALDAAEAEIARLRAPAPAIREAYETPRSYGLGALATIRHEIAETGRSTNWAVPSGNLLLIASYIEGVLAGDDIGLTDAPSGTWTRMKGGSSILRERAQSWSQNPEAT